MQPSSNSWCILLATLALFLAEAVAEHIDGNVVLKQKEISPENVIIALNSRLTLVDNTLASITGKFVNDGVFFLTCSASHDSKQRDGFRGAVLGIRGGDFINNHQFVFDHSKARTESMVSIDSYGEIKNSGNMWFIFGGQSQEDFFSTADGNQRYRTHLKLTSGLILNKGKIMVSSKDYKIEALIGLDARESGVFTNDGALCLRNTNFFLQDQLRGEGCISVGPDTVLNLCGVELGPEQTIYVNPQDGKAEIRFCLTRYPETPIPVRGFGRLTKLTIVDFSDYTFEKDGILSLIMRGGAVLLIDLGPGYDPEIMDIAVNEEPSEEVYITYDRLVDVSEPANCQCQFDYFSAIGQA